MAAGALAPDLGLRRRRRLGPGSAGRRRPGRARSSCSSSVVLGVGLGSVRIGPTETVGVILWRTLGLDVGLDWSPATRGDRLGPAAAAGPDRDGRSGPGWPWPAPRSRGCCATRWPIRTCSGRRRGRRSARRSRSCIPVQLVVVEFGLLHGLAFAGALLAAYVVFRLGGSGRRRRAHPPAADGLRRGVRAGGAPDDGDVRLGRRPAPDLLVPARWPRRRVVAPARDRGAADHRRVRPDDAARARARRPAARRRRRRPSRHRRPAGTRHPAGPGVAGDRGRRSRSAGSSASSGSSCRTSCGSWSARRRGGCCRSPRSSGAALLSAADLVARLVGDIPVGVVMALLGAPFFLFLLQRTRSGYEL